MEIRNVGGELIIPVKLLNDRQLKYVTVRSVKAYFVNHKLIKYAKQKYVKSFKFLRRHHVGPIVNDLESLIHTMDGQDLFSYGHFHNDHNLLQYVYPGYGVTPYEKKLPLYRTYFPGIVKFTKDRNVVNVHLPVEHQAPGEYTLIVKIEVEHTHHIHKDAWMITLNVGELTLPTDVEPEPDVDTSYYVYSDKDDDSAIVYSSTSDSDIVTV